MGERAERQAVPRGELLVVPGRPRPSGPRGQERVRVP